MTHVNQSCMTPDSWRDAFRNMQQRRQQAASANCSTLNVSQDAHQVTFDMNCSSQQGFTSNVHVQMLLDSEEAMHGNATVKMSGPNFPRAFDDLHHHLKVREFRLWRREARQSKPSSLIAVPGIRSPAVFR